MRPPSLLPEQDRPQSEYRVPIDSRSLLVAALLCGAIPLALWAFADPVRVVGLVAIAVMGVVMARLLRRVRWVSGRCARVTVPGTSIAVEVAVTRESR